MPQPGVNESRAAFRERHIAPGYSGPLHLATTITVSLSVALLCIVMLENVRPLEWLTVPFTFVYANLSEYLGHRGPMHHRNRFLSAVFQRHSVEHHAFFTDGAASFDSTRDYKAVLFPPVLLLFFIGCFAVPVAAVLYFLTSANVAFLFVMTSVLYFLNYELLHFAYHSDPQTWIGRLPLMHSLRRHHIRHHNRQLMTRCNFNITYPLCDYLFGTLYKDNEQQQDFDLSR
jgi:Fatty acid hydroxylase superfamily